MAAAKRKHPVRFKFVEATYPSYAVDSPGGAIHSAQWTGLFRFDSIVDNDDSLESRH
jgi:hypothetical protein